MSVKIASKENRTEIPAWVSVAYAANWASLHPSTIHKLIAAGKLQATYFTGRALRVKFSSLEALAVKNSTGKWAVA